MNVIPRFRRANPIGPTVRLYHGSFLGNVSSILERGIVPRREIHDCNTFIDRILAEYGLERQDIEPWIWRYPLERCQETAEYVYLSADPEYALGNSLAGFEAEDELRRHLAGLTGVEYEPPDRDSILCRIEVPSELVFDDEKRAIYADCMLATRATGDPVFEDEDHILRTIFRQVRLDRPVPARWIKACWSTRRPEFYNVKKKKTA